MVGNQDSHVRSIGEARKSAPRRGSTDEPWAAFKGRARVEAGEAAGARSLLIGGLPDGVGAADIDHLDRGAEDPPRGAIVLPEAALHPSQIEALDLIREHRRVALVCGRRWGKSTILITLAVDAALSGKRVGVFAPTRTLMSPLLMEIVAALRSVRRTSINTVLGEIRLLNGGHVDFWSIDHTQRAGRGRKYHLVLIDEAAHDEGYLGASFPTAIAPTLLDYAGSIVEASTPNGVEPSPSCKPTTTKVAGSHPTRERTTRPLCSSATTPPKASPARRSPKPWDACSRRTESTSKRSGPSPARATS